MKRPHPDNELRRKLWELVAKWQAKDMVEPASYFADQLMEALAYPLALEEDDEGLLRAYGKTSAELAEEAEQGYPVDHLVARSLDAAGSDGIQEFRDLGDHIAEG